MEKYYNIKPKDNQRLYGVVVKVDESKLEAFACTEQDIIELGCKLDSEGNLSVKREYIVFNIDETNAKILKQVYAEFCHRQKAGGKTLDLTKKWN